MPCKKMKLISESGELRDLLAHVSWDAAVVVGQGGNFLRGAGM
jgi:hypothetical protein